MDIKHKDLTNVKIFARLIKRNMVIVQKKGVILLVVQRRRSDAVHFGVCEIDYMQVLGTLRVEVSLPDPAYNVTEHVLLHHTLSAVMLY